MNKSLHLQFDNIECHSCGCQSNKKEVLDSLESISSYDYDNRTYENNSEPIENAWEVIVSGDEAYIYEEDTSVNILEDGLFFYCPDCTADLDKIE